MRGDEMGLGFRSIYEGYGVSLGRNIYAHICASGSEMRNLKNVTLNKQKRLPEHTFHIECGKDVHRVILREDGALAFPDHPRDDLMDKVDMILGIMHAKDTDLIDVSLSVDPELTLGCAMFITAWRESILYYTKRYIDMCVSYSAPPKLRNIMNVVLRRKMPTWVAYDVLEEIRGDPERVKEMKRDRMKRNALRRIIRKSCRKAGWNIIVVQTNTISYEVIHPLYMTQVEPLLAPLDNMYYIGVRQGLWNVYRKCRTLCCKLPPNEKGISRKAIIAGADESMKTFEVFLSPSGRTQVASIMVKSDTVELIALD